VVIALVDGPAVGFGCDLALACDLRVATTAAYFQEKFVRIGLIPDGGGTFWLPRMIGLARAAELIMLGERLEAEEAHRLGLVNRLVAPADGEGAARELAARLAKGPPLALRLMKESMLRNLNATVDQALDQEKAAQAQCLQSADLFEGVAAFFEKREPRFRGET
jgi:2-(1,2-epoxy-1,2-dihydrophenyl)acetyl-CoA isomerase